MNQYDALRTTSSSRSLLLLPLKSIHFPTKSMLENHLRVNKSRLRIFRISHLSCHCTLHCKKALAKNKTLNANLLTEVLSNVKLCMIQSKYQDNKMLIRRVSSHYSAYHECSKRFA